MANRPIRVILDTNLWISFLITKNYPQVDLILFSGKIKLIFSEELLAEFIAVAQRAKFRKYFSQSNLEDLVAMLNEVAEFIKVDTITTVCRDEKDNFLLSLAVDGEADYLISGDYDLLDLKVIGKTRIIAIAELPSYINQHI